MFYVTFLRHFYQPPQSGESNINLSWFPNCLTQSARIYENNCELLKYLQNRIILEKSIDAQYFTNLDYFLKQTLRFITVAGLP